MAQTQNATASKVGYDAALGWLRDNRPHMVDYITSLGEPKSSPNCKRAMVMAGWDLVPTLYVNDDFLQEIGPAQAAGVLVHEWRHVLLGHLGESAYPKRRWRYPVVLDATHEAIINDSLELTGYFLPEDVIRGEARGGEFYGYWSTDEGYGPMERWYLSQQQRPKPPESDSEDGEKDEEGQGGSSSDDSTDSDSDSPSDSSGEGEDADGEQGDSSGQGEPSDSSSSDSSGDSDSSDSSDSSGSSSSSGSSGQAEPGEGSEGSGSPEDDLNGEPSEGSCNHGGGQMEDADGNIRPMTETEFKTFEDMLNEIVADAIKQTPMPDDEKPTENELDAMDQDVAEAIDPDRANPYSKAGIVANEAEKVLAGGKLNLGWLKLLQKINPDVGKADGGLNSKASYNWARPRRSTSLIRGAMLPTPGEPRGAGIGTKMKPIALIALDFSGSIDRRLAYALKDMAQSIPEEHIEARCFTFSTQAVPFDFKAKNNSVASGGTDFSCIEIEARKIQKETGEYPYVICLTDGEAWFEGYGTSYGNGSYSRYGDAAAPTALQLSTRWLWVDVLTETDQNLFSSGYSQVRQQKNKSPLPYDRSKL